MGCICSKEYSIEDCAGDAENEKEKSKSLVKVAPSKTEDIVVEIGNVSYDESVHTISQPVVPATMSSAPATKDEEKKTRIVERPKSGLHYRRATADVVMNGGESTVSRIVTLPDGIIGEQVAAGWPSWLTSVAGEAIQGWLPRSADSFEKLEKIGQGTYSTVYRARDLKTRKIVAMKKVRFVNMDPESVRFMAREILILRKLDHPNVMKLECIVTSRMSGSLYLVFEYMEHDLAGLAASPKIKFTEPQIKCYVQQLLHGLEHCHSRGILHRDIKGSNLLVDNDGNLKIGDFGLANFFKPNQKQPLTSRVVTLWYRAPELLLGATDYDVAIDLWSVGCILAELFVGKPIMPGRTEVEQMHKIFKLCGSPSEEYWRKSKLPHATSFKPQHPYKRCVAETFKDFPSPALALIDVLLAIEPEHRGTAASALNNEFFTTKPFPCDPCSLPKFPPSKEIDVKFQQEEARRRKAGYVKGHGPESVRGPRRGKEVTPELDAQGQGQANSKCTSVRFNPLEDGGSGFPIDPPRGGGGRNGLSQSNSMLHPTALGSTWTRKAKDDNTGIIYRTGKGLELGRQMSNVRRQALDSSKKDERMTARELTGRWASNRRRIHYSGPLIPPGGNVEEMLREHERQIQEAVRKARLDKSRTQKDF